MSASPITGAITGNVVHLPAAHPLVKRHNTTPEQMRAMVRDLALWMYDHGVEHFAMDRQPCTAKFILTVDGTTT